MASVTCTWIPPFLKFLHPKSPPELARELPPAAVVNAVEGGELAKRWCELMGQNNWEGLLDPLDPLLRLELIKYGDLSQSTHEAFISDNYSRNYGACKFHTGDIFHHTLMPKVGYDATKLIYATSEDAWWNRFFDKPVNAKTWNRTNIFIGFVAVSDADTSRKLGRRDICVSWRGTSTPMEWAANLRDFLVPMPADEHLPQPDPNVKVETGFLNLYADKDEQDRSSARETTLREVKRLINQARDDGEEVSVTLTGHSLGAALALLSAYDIMETGTSCGVPVCAITFAGPRVGNNRFKKRVESLGLKVLRVVNVHDKVPRLPGLVFNEKWPGWALKALEFLRFPWIYTHVGTLLELNSDDSPFFKELAEINPLSGPHKLDGYIHLVDGYHGSGLSFESATGRDLALVNRSSDLLLEQYEIPPNWRVKENRGMVQNNGGRWVHISRLVD